MVESNIRASIITPHFENPNGLVSLHTALLHQTINSQDFEWIIVDDASPGGLPIWIDEYSGPLNLKVVRRLVRGGVAKTRNSGMLVARGATIVLFDSDMVPFPDWLERMLLCAETTNSIILGKLLPHPDLPRTAYLRYYHTRGAAKLPIGVPAPGKYLTGADTAFHRSWFERTGGFDESFTSWGGEDLEWGLRIEKLGGEVLRQPRARAWHNHRIDWDTTEIRYREYGRSTVPYLLQKHPSLHRLLTLDLVDAEPSMTLSRRIASACVKRVYSRKLYRILRNLTLKFPGFFWPNIVFDYLIYYLYSSEYLEERSRL